MDCVSICAPRIAQDAALFGIEQLAHWRDEKRALMDARAEALPPRLFAQRPEV